jgi:RNA recognition motif-containing protein
MMQQPAGAVPQPMDQNQQPQQYGQGPPPPQHPWMMMPQAQPMQQAPQVPGQMWPQGQPQQYPAASPVTNQDEVRSLWIGDLQFWMDENFLWGCFAPAGEVIAVKLIRNKQTGQPEGYGFIEFATRAAAERVLLTYNGAMMPSTEIPFRLNWASLGAGQKRQDDSPDYPIFVGDLAPDVTDYTLQETFRAHYSSVKGAKVITDHTTGRSKGYGFVRFGDESEQIRAMTEMNGMLCSSKPMRVGPAANKKPVAVQQKVPYQNTQGNPGENDPTNTTIFVGGLDPNVSDEQLRQVFSQFGELVHVKIPAGKRCGFVQFANRGCAEQALSALNGTQIGGHNVRLSWGHSPANKQAQPTSSQWNGGNAGGAPGGGGGYYGYPQGYEGYGYTAPPQDPNMYYGGYPGYGNYQQQQQ